MPISTLVAGTPYYVLLNENRRIGPTVMRLDSGNECRPIYGFSDKGLYDTFCTNSPMELTPYPLVTVYLRDQTDLPGDDLKLVVIDAAGPREPSLRAATMEAVLQAQENRTAHVTTAYQLIFDPAANAYRVGSPSGDAVD